MHSKLAIGTLVFMALTAQTLAADISSCPDVSAIKSSPYSDPSLGKFAGGFKYEAISNGKKWEGVTAGTDDDYLDPKYKLKAEGFNQANGKLTCIYGGATLVVGEPGEEAYSNPFLKLHAPE
ncbi:MAG: hypothetical protein ACRC1I_28800 [Pseudomonas proteolytica]|uniref:hypothetical protein n=1 Tax=Pseudomonas proteolytica TaxID=219574 RepID=UPI003F3832E4